MTSAATSPIGLTGIGECMVEFHASVPLSEAKALNLGVGGDVANSLVAFTRLGGTAAFISGIGDDPFGPTIRNGLTQCGLDLSQARTRQADNGLYFISVTEDGEREFTYRRTNTAASQVGPADIDPDFIARSSWLLLSGITQAISASASAATLEAARIARDAGLKIAYDPNYRPRLWELRGGIDAAREAFNDVCPLVDWIFPSHPADAVLLDASEEQAADPLWLLSRFGERARNVGLKCGADGALLLHNGQVERIGAAPVTRIIDTSGAGDMWNGSFIYGLHAGMAPADAAALANRMAARKLAFRGAIPPAEMYAQAGA